MPGRSIARSVQVALLGLTIVLTTIAALGVAGLYQGRQDYEDRLTDALRLQAGAGRLLAAGVVEEATLQLTADAAARERARQAFGTALADARRLAGDDEPSQALITRAVRGQQSLRRRSAGGGGGLGARPALAQLSARQDDRIEDAGDDAAASSRRAVIAIVAGGGLALLSALALVTALLRAVRRPLDALVVASQRLAGGDHAARVPEDGPDELAALARSFNAMAVDLESASARVEAERRRLDLTVRSLGDALVVVAADGTVEVANPRARDLLPDARPGWPLPTEPAPLQEALLDEVTVEREGRTLAVTASRLETGGIVWTVRDVSERARLERLKSEFVATASHELRSPLTSIKGFVELLGATELSDRQRDWLGVVLQSTDRLVDLVNDLLDVARVEAGRVEVHRRPTDLRDLVDEVAVLLQPRLLEKQQALEVDVAGPLPRVLIDPARIRQVLTNLLTNAHLYTPEGGTLAIDVRRTEGHAVTLTVRDTGRGIAPDELPHVFDRFYRGGDEATGPAGTGLGLAIVRSLVDLHGGTIGVASEVGKGTTFTIRLPRVFEQDEGGTSAARQALAGRRVLVVDDEVDVARLIAERLTPYGVESEVVTSGAAALAQLRNGRFDAVTLDILMPGMSGFEVLRAIRADPELRRVPVVIVSVFSGREALSGEWAVAKPIDAEELADALGAAVLAGRVRVLAVGRPTVRERLDAALGQLGIEHEWAFSAAEAATLCRERYYEVAAVDAGLPAVGDVLAALDLRGRRLKRSVVVFQDGASDGAFARLDADPVALEDAGAVVLGLLGA